MKTDRLQEDAIELATLDISGLFRKYFVPTLLGMLGISAVTAVDGIFVGHGVGADGIAAINIFVPLLMVFTGIGLMAGVGCSVVSSIQLAKGKGKVARLNVTQSFLFVSLLSVAATAVVMLWPRQTALLLGASEHLMPLVTDYMLWFMPAILFQMWTAVGLFIIRLDGSPRIAMWCSLIEALANIVLDYVFIFPLGWGLRGAAFATTVSVVIGGLIAIGYLLFSARNLRLIRLKMSVKSLRLSIRNIGYHCQIGSSALLGEATMAMLMFMGNLVFMKYLGDNGVGAFGIACYYMPFVFMVGNAIAQSAQPIISYNFGKGCYERVHATERIALITAVVCGLSVTGFFVGFPRLLVGLFLDPADAAAQIAIDGLPYFATGFICFIINLTVVGYFQSIERVKPATLFALLRGLIFLVPSFLLMPLVLGTPGIWLAMPASEILTSLTILCFRNRYLCRDELLKP